MTVISDISSKLNVNTTKGWAPTPLPKKIQKHGESAFVTSENILSNGESKVDMIIPLDRKHHAV